MGGGGREGAVAEQRRRAEIGIHRRVKAQDLDDTSGNPRQRGIVAIQRRQRGGNSPRGNPRVSVSVAVSRIFPLSFFLSLSLGVRDMRVQGVCEMCRSLRMYVDVSACKCMYVHVCRCMSMYVDVCRCMSMHVDVCR